MPAIYKVRVLKPRRATYLSEVKGRILGLICLHQDMNSGAKPHQQNWAILSFHFSHPAEVRVWLGIQTNSLSHRIPSQVKYGFPGTA